jgi:Ser/Thr protein kinase RdoA (MazF antagonist)
MEAMLKEALIQYSLGKKSLFIEKNLPSWSKDLHFKIRADCRSFSARFIQDIRSPNNVFGNTSREILYEQCAVCHFLAENHIPFMRLIPASINQPFIELNWENEHYWFILFEWMDGQHITHCDNYISKEFGHMARKFHDLSSSYQSSVFQKKSHLVGYEKFLTQLRDKLHSLDLSGINVKLMEEYLGAADEYISCARSQQMDYIIQSDLNPLNILWNEEKKVIGIVDFESIGHVDRIEGLAWLIKWYSRTNGIHSPEMSPAAAHAFLKGYRAEDFLDKGDMHRLASLLWLSGCLNWNFVKGTISILETRNDETLINHLESYWKRGRNLLRLLSEATY